MSQVRVGLVVVSHSAILAGGVAELAAQMAPDVTLVPAGGTPDGGLGTDLEAVSAALDRAEHGAGVVLLYDLGSAKMIADLAVEALAEPDRAVVVDAPLVEGAVAAAVAAQGGADLAAVAAAAMRGEAVEEAAGGAEVSAEETAEIPLTNEIGLHARPAALLARSVSDVDAQVTVAFAGKQADARSILAVMALGARGGDTVRVSAAGPQAAEALRRVRDLADRRFDE
ncbi:MAG TPA: dihydroxyacetone kinase phosphoryl donor subunit DhaM [Actinophytocola sp.]|uniref:dihydroxyacetone kinase phosphoryl donor subunit DhaM n=1 Tax=Actinophytocola sp. TaxID=1872138 RepID=UPI002DDCFE4F|nr:dihydroxyacetone kinase phosphoryl donor subunit DhaM [Actinophytocola sp.]HEV2779815.1 dihydroxyacetone kinase phosphoryl donor subunit DhaM [Actinophytocola sp.]